MNDLKEHYVGLPEYDNIKEAPPEITATFKFKTKEDFDVFHQKVKEVLYNGERVFDGMQKKDVKSSWYPLKVKGSKYGYE
jgi:hypothetical protein